MAYCPDPRYLASLERERSKKKRQTGKGMLCICSKIKRGSSEKGRKFGKRKCRTNPSFRKLARKDINRPAAHTSHSFTLPLPSLMHSSIKPISLVPVFFAKESKMLSKKQLSFCGAFLLLSSQQPCRADWEDEANVKKPLWTSKPGSLPHPNPHGALRSLHHLFPNSWWWGGDGGGRELTGCSQSLPGLVKGNRIIEKRWNSTQQPVVWKHSWGFHLVSNAKLNKFIKEWESTLLSFWWASCWLSPL